MDDGYSGASQRRFREGEVHDRWPGAPMADTERDPAIAAVGLRFVTPYDDRRTLGADRDGQADRAQQQCREFTASTAAHDDREGIATLAE